MRERGCRTFGAIRYNSTIASIVPFGGAYPTYQLTIPRPSHGTVTDTGARIACSATQSACALPLGAPGLVTLTATADPGFTFVGWSANCTGGGATTTVRVNQPSVCDPIFQSTDPGVLHTGLFMDSQAGEPIGQGRQWFYNPSNAAFTVSRTDASNGAGIQVSLAADTLWTLQFDANAKAALAPGTYFGAIGYPFNGFNAGMSISGHSLGCSGTGWFTVYELAVATDGSVQSFAADFEQHCNNDPGLFGAIRYNSTIGSFAPFGGSYPLYRVTVPRPAHGTVTSSVTATNDRITCSATQDACALTLTAPAPLTLTATADPGFTFIGWSASCSGGATTTVRVNQPLVCDPVFDSTSPAVAHTGFFMDSQAGDPIGQGRQRFYNASNASFTVSRNDPSNGSGIHVSIVGDTTWSVDVDANGRASLVPGTYVGAKRFPFNGLSAGLDISGNGSGCSQETGWFVVRQLITATDGSVIRFAADIEQHCNNADAGLFAAIRYNSTVPLVAPFDGAYPSYRLTIPIPAHGTIGGDGITCAVADGTCTATLSAPGSVTLTATPGPGFVFLGWSGSCFGGATISVRLNQPLVCEALFDSLTTPALRTGVFFDSQPGDFVGQGRQWMFNAANSSLTISQNGTPTHPGVHLNLTADSSWSIDFAADNNGVLTPGAT